MPLILLLTLALIGLAIYVFLWQKARAATFFTPRQAKAFMALVQRYFVERQIPAHYNADDGMIRVDGGGVKADLGLSNLAQTCHDAPQFRWPTLITAHFDLMFQALRKNEALEADLQDFEKVRDILVVTLKEREAISHTSQLVAREDLPGLLTYLALDLPNTVQSVTRDEIAVWGKSEDELFALGLRNVLRLSQPKITAHKVTSGVHVISFNGESHYVHAHALLLAEHPECIGPQGALIALPIRHMLVCFPIRDENFDAVAKIFTAMARDISQKGPGGITDKLFRYQNGKFTEYSYPAALAPGKT